MKPRTLLKRSSTLITLTTLTLTLAWTPVAQGKGSKVFDILDKATKKEGLDAQKSTLKKFGSPAKVLKAIRSGRRPSSPLSAGTHEKTIKDDYGRSTDLNIVVPSGRSPKKGFGLLILLHGLGGNGKQLIPQYESFAKKKRLIIIAPSAKKLPSGGAKGPNGQSLPGNEDTMGREMLQHWWLYRDNGFVLNGLSYIKKNAFIDTDRIYLSGYSMGGYGTWNIGLRYHDNFAALIPLAGALSRRERYGMVDNQSRPLIKNGRYLPIYFVHGAKDKTVPPESDRRNAKQLKELKAPFIYKEDPNAAHNLMAFLSANRKEMNQWISKQRRNSSPKVIEHQTIGSYMRRCYWIEITEEDGDNAFIKGKIVGKNKIEMTAKNVKSFRLYFDDNLLKTNKALTVTCNGKTIFTGKVKESHEAILHSWLNKEDPALVYSREKEFKVP